MEVSNKINKVFHIIDDFFWTSVYTNLLKGLECNGVTSTVACPCTYKRVLPDKIPINVFPLPCYSNWHRFFFLLKEKNILSSLLNKNFPVSDYDLFHGHTLFSNGYVAWQLAKLYKKPFFVTVRNSDLNVFFKYRLNLRKTGVKIMNEAAGIIFLSEAYRKTTIEKYIPVKYRDKFMEKSTVIPNGIHDSFFENAFKHPPLNNSETIKVISVGEVNKNKNHFTVCQAVDILRAEGMDVTLQIFGAATIPDEIKKIQRFDFVRYNPPVPHPQLIRHYREHDLFVLASHTETFGLVYAEAMTQGLPVLYTAGQGFDKQFPEGVVGYSIDNNSPKDIAEKIKRAILNYAELSQNSFAMSEKFKSSNTAKMHIDYYCDRMGE